MTGFGKQTVADNVTVTEYEDYFKVEYDVGYEFHLYKGSYGYNQIFYNSQELEVLNSHLQELNGSTGDVLATLANVNQQLAALVQTLETEIQNQQTQRKLEKDTLTKLNKYLDDWV